MGTVGEETLEMLFCFGDGVWPRDADDAEALRARLRDKPRLERGRIVQKSRSA
jgi:hypothetical protein